MDEEKKAERAIEKGAGNDTEDGNKPKAGSIVAEANSAAERLAAENERMEANIKMLQELNVINQLSGKATKSPEEEKKGPEGLDYIKSLQEKNFHG